MPQGWFDVSGRSCLISLIFTLWASLSPNSSGSYSKTRSSTSSTSIGQPRSSRRYSTREGKSAMDLTRSRSRLLMILLRLCQLHPSFQACLDPDRGLNWFQVLVLDVLLDLLANTRQAFLWKVPTTLRVGFA